MRPTFLVVIVFLISSIFTKCQNTYSEKSPESVLRDFYTEYMTVIASELNRPKEDAIKQRHCTKELLTKMENQFKSGELDYDPFLKAQDANLENLPSLKIEDLNQDHTYRVSYIDNFSKDKIEIYLKLNDSLKIESVW